MTDWADRTGLKDPETLQGYACIAIAAALGLTVITIMILSIAHWITN
jgi:hypothetical protein